jgi:hypothetical protein
MLAALSALRALGMRRPVCALSARARALASPVVVGLKKETEATVVRQPLVLEVDFGAGRAQLVEVPAQLVAAALGHQVAEGNERGRSGKPALSVLVAEQHLGVRQAGRRLHPANHRCLKSRPRHDAGLTRMAR